MKILAWQDRGRRRGTQMPAPPTLFVVSSDSRGGSDGTSGNEPRSCEGSLFVFGFCRSETARALMTGPSARSVSMSVRRMRRYCGTMVFVAQLTAQAARIVINRRWPNSLGPPALGLIRRAPRSMRRLVLMSVPDPSAWGAIRARQDGSQRRGCDLARHMPCPGGGLSRLSQPNGTARACRNV